MRAVVVTALIVATCSTGHAAELNARAAIRQTADEVFGHLSNAPNRHRFAAMLARFVRVTGHALDKGLFGLGLAKARIRPFDAGKSLWAKMVGGRSIDGVVDDRPNDWHRWLQVQSKRGWATINGLQSDDGASWEIAVSPAARPPRTEAERRFAAMQGSERYTPAEKKVSTTWAHGHLIESREWSSRERLLEPKDCRALPMLDINLRDGNAILEAHLALVRRFFDGAITKTGRDLGLALLSRVDTVRALTAGSIEGRNDHHNIGVRGTFVDPQGRSFTLKTMYHRLFDRLSLTLSDADVEYRASLDIEKRRPQGFSLEKSRILDDKGETSQQIEFAQHGRSLGERDVADISFTYETMQPHPVVEDK
jgi:hypothetical protein